jgi:DNA-binding PadR family transcriptional regulator
MQQVRSLSDGTFRIGPGVLYTTIQRLLVSELIREEPAEDAEHRRRRCYILTASGRRLLKAEFERMNALVHQGREMELVLGHAE